jgi:hypothetical protein
MPVMTDEDRREIAETLFKPDHSRNEIKDVTKLEEDRQARSFGREHGPLEVLRLSRDKANMTKGSGARPDDDPRNFPIKRKRGNR